MARKRVTLAVDPVLAVDVRQVDLEVPTRSLERPPDRLRYEAGAIYVTHPDGVTVDELARDPRFASLVSRETLQTWCTQDGWVAARKEVLARFGEKLRSTLQRELFSRVAQARIDQLNTVKSLKDSLSEKALNAEVKSAEGAAKVWVDLARHELELVQTVGQELGAGVAGFTGQAIDARNTLTDEEALEAARLVLRGRRQQRQSLPPLPVTALLPPPKGVE